MNKLTIEEAQAVINYIRRAPLVNMDEAESVAGLLVKLKAYFEMQFNPPVSPEKNNIRGG